VVRDDKGFLVAGKGKYSEHAALEISVKEPRSLTNQAIQRRVPAVVHSKLDPRVQICLERLSGKAREVIENMESHGTFPLRVAERSVGALSLQSSKPELFNEDLVTLCSRVANVAALAAYDWIVQTTAEIAEEQRIAIKQEEVRREAAARFAHRLGNTLPIALNRINDIALSQKDELDTIEDCAVARRQIERALDMARQFFCQNQPHLPM